MLISHLHKFIYLKTIKTAGSSVEEALYPYLGEEDIAAASGEHLQKNNKYDFFEHDGPEVIISRIGKAIWDEYDIIANIRNPWDAQVSLFHFVHSDWVSPLAPPKKINKGQTIGMGASFRHPMTGADRIIDNSCAEFDEDGVVQAPKELFENWVFTDRCYRTNCGFLFDENGKHIPDIVLRYENLQQDYNSLCDKFNIPRNTLPRRKVEARQTWKQTDYKKYYTEKSRKLIEKYSKQVIEYYGYKF